MSSLTKVTKADSEWKKELSTEEFRVLRQKGTEAPYKGEYDGFYPKKGHFVCKACQNPLYTAASKFKSGCGWPAFDQCVKGSIKTISDSSMGMSRIEILCAACDGHLGHVFRGERITASNERHCVNSVSVKYVDEPLENIEQEIITQNM